MTGIKNIVKGIKPLKSLLVDLIRMRGPLSVADYMKLVLTNPASGFYMNKDVFGVKGDFTTSPEVSQMFGEVVGIWLLNEWQRFGMPKPLRLVEFGPGRGTLMSDIVRTIGKFHETKKILKVDLIEVSPRLKEIQANTLSNISNIKWHSHIENLEEGKGGFTAFIAHEYFDALPIHKFIKDPISKNWKELVIDFDKEEELRFCISHVKSPSLLLVPENIEGNHFEVSPESALQLQRVAKHLDASRQGCMLICDYGFELSSNRDTFRGFKNHELWPPLQRPGEADLTADVDFRFLKNAIQDSALTFGSVTQKNFLDECGLGIRLKSLLESASEAERPVLISEAEMLLRDMGERFRFMALFPKDSKKLFHHPPAGFISSVR